MMRGWREGHYKAIGDAVALAVLLGYAWLAWGAGGAGPSGPALDPVWAAARERGSLRVAIDPGFRPFAEERDGQIVGYDADLARAIGARLGLGVVFVPTGFDALYDSLTSGRADLIASALPYAPEQGERARFSQFYFDDGQVLVLPAGSSAAGLEDLRGSRVGVALGSPADSLARRAAPEIGLTLVNSYDLPQQALADLRAGRLDAVICDNVAALSAAQADPALRLGPALSSEPFALAMPRAAFQLEAEVNRALAELRAEGFFAELNRRWFVPDSGAQRP